MRNECTNTSCFKKSDQPSNKSVRFSNKDDIRLFDVSFKEKQDKSVHFKKVQQSVIRGSSQARPSFERMLSDRFHQQRMAIYLEQNTLRSSRASFTDLPSLQQEYIHSSSNQLSPSSVTDLTGSLNTLSLKDNIPFADEAESVDDNFF